MRGEIYMKKILAFLLSVIMVMSMGIASFSALDEGVNPGAQAGASFDEVTPDEASKDEASKDEASKDEASKDEASKDEATYDESKLRQLVLEFILSSVNEDVDLFAYVDYSIDMRFVHKSEATADYAVFDLNFADDFYDYEGTTVTCLKIGDRLYVNEVNGMVSCYLGLGYYAVIPETRQVMLLEDAVSAGLENIEDECLSVGICRRIGDADGDGELTVRDATYIQKGVAGLEGYEFESGLYGFARYSYSDIFDFDGNNKIDVRDSTNIRKYLADLPFCFEGNPETVSTVIPEGAEALECNVVRGNGMWWSEERYYEMYDYVGYFTSAQEYAAASLDEGDIYNEEYFESNNLVFVHRIMGSGSYGYRLRGVYKQGDTLYVDTCIMDIRPSHAMTDDMNYIAVYVELPKETTSEVVRAVKFTDTRFFPAQGESREDYY